nr:unnamed protein product [Callosobruchus chinensis]
MAEQFSSKGKRKRDPNTSFDEKTKLISLIRKYFETIENKKTDAVSVLKKKGGGPSQGIHMDPMITEVLELIQYGAVGCLNPFDSDGAFDNGVQYATKKKSVRKAVIGATFMSCSMLWPFSYQRITYSVKITLFSSVTY